MKKILTTCALALISTIVNATTIQTVIPKGSTFAIDMNRTPPLFPSKYYDVEVHLNKFNVKDKNAVDLSKYKMLILKGRLTINDFNASNESYKTTLLFTNTIFFWTPSDPKDRGVVLSGNVYFVTSNAASIISAGQLNHNMNVLGQATPPASSKGVVFLSTRNNSREVHIQALQDIPLTIMLNN